ncbi:MAG: 2-C-methyl-D-erythritol 2,4-cyclodiphosphate synthase [Candidatus Omnitrophota bacterium]
MKSRIGIGYDIHRLVEGRPLFIGGVEIPYIKGLLGHTDGDALLHAICDAILGGLAEGDIGEHFPDNDERYYGISSTELLKETIALMKKRGFAIGNIDAVVIAQEPILSPFKKQIERKIAEVIGILEGCVNVKAKTNEGIGELGRKEAIAAYAVVIMDEGV